MKTICKFLFGSLVLALPVSAQPTLFGLDATSAKRTEINEIPGFMGKSPSGTTLAVNNRYFEKNGKPWFPLMGEFHYWRFPAEYWEEQLVKMKSAGLGMVSTYVYWGAHEKTEGDWNWSGRLDLRHFVELCAKHGLQVWLRPGPYINGDVRGRGFPDRIYTMPGKRSNKPEYLAEVGQYYRQVGEQVKGLWFGEGGPIIGVQLENEFASGERTHIARLKALAADAGMQPVYWSVTANTVFRDDTFEVLPLQGAYCYRGWEQGHSLTTDFLFAEDQWIMDANFGRLYYDVEKYPRATCEQGAGMQETHIGRFIVDPAVMEAHAANQVGRGINMLGYFMFQGGTQYPGTEMPESDGPLMPSGLVSYDYQAPLDEFGRVTDSYKYLKLIHLFANDFGDRLVKTDVFRPAGLPDNPDDLTTLRYTGRFDADGHGFMFVCNTQNYRTMTDKTVQFKLKLPDGELVFPQQPVTFTNERIAAWPVNFPFGGLNIRYATAQVLCRVDEAGTENLFLYETEGIPAEIALRRSEAGNLEISGFEHRQAGDLVVLQRTKLPASVTVKNPGEKPVTIHVLSREVAENSWKVNLNGQDYLVVTQADLLVYPDRLALRQTGNPTVAFSVFPDLKLKGASKDKGSNGAFSTYTVSVKKAAGQVDIAYPNDSTAVLTARGKLPSQVSDWFARIGFTGNLGTATVQNIRVADRLNYGKEWVVGLKRFWPQLSTDGQPMTIAITGDYSGLKPGLSPIELVPEYEAILPLPVQNAK